MIGKRSDSLVLLFIIFVSLLLTACTKETEQIHVTDENLPHNEHVSALQALFPLQEITWQNANLFVRLDQSNETEAFDMRALSALQVNMPIYWYPSIAYLPTLALGDYNQPNTELTNETTLPPQERQHTQLHILVEGQEHQLFAIVYIIIAIIWIGSISQRAMQNGVRRPAFICGILLICWILLRTLKYSLPPDDILTHYVWYCYYLFELSIPLVLLWMALVIDKPDNEQNLPKWWFCLAGMNAVLALLVLTNDLHQFAFRVDFSGDNWTGNDLAGNNWISHFNYGPIYFVIAVSIALQVLLAQIIMMQKCWHSSRRYLLWLSVIIYLLLGAYGIAYILRFPFVWYNGLTITAGILALIYMEICVQIGLVPVNRNYRQFFEQSPQNMQIIRDTGESVLMSAAAVPLEPEIWKQLAQNPGQPLPFGENELIFGDSIHGGIVIWHEDIHYINILNRKIEVSMKNLESVNAILEKVEIISRNLATAKAQIALFAGMEHTIHRHTECLSAMLHNIPTGKGRKEYLTRVAMKVCYIKRCCQLFFSEQKATHMETHELAAYLDELAEFAQHAGINCCCVCTFRGRAPLIYITLIYDFVHSVLDWLFEHNGKSMLIQISRKNSSIAVTVMQPADISEFIPDSELLAKAKAVGGMVSVNPIAELGSTCFCLAFLGEGGIGNA